MQKDRRTLLFNTNSNNTILKTKNIKINSTTVLLPKLEMLCCCYCCCFAFIFCSWSIPKIAYGLQLALCSEITSGEVWETNVVLYIEPCSGLFKASTIYVVNISFEGIFK